MMMRADENANIVEGCTAEELLACIAGDNYDECVASCGSEEEPTLPGYATVSTKAAAAQTVALNAVEKKIGTVTLKAGENDTTVTSVEITKSGLGDINDVETIQLMKNGEYVSNAASFSNSTKKATLRFSPKLVLKANSSATFDVVVSLDGVNANGQHNFAVTAVTVANGSFGGTPANLGSLTTTNYSVGTVTTDVNGEIDVAAATSTPKYTVNAGDENTEIAEISVKPEVDSIVTSITLTSKQDELDKAFSNVKAYIDDEVVGTVSVNDETITIEGLNKTVKANKNLEVVLKGDITYVGDDTVKVFYVEANHVNATETNTNERMSSILSEYYGVKIQGVDLTIKNLVKKTEKVAPGTDDIVLMDLEVSAGSDLEVSEYYVEFPSTFDFGEYKDSKVTLYVDGINYDIKASDLNTYQYVISAKKDSFPISAGEKIKVQVKADSEDIAATTVNGLTFGINVVKNTETNKTIGTPGTALDSETGHKTTFEAGNIVVKNTKKGSNNLIKEGTTADVLSFSIKANNEKVTLKTLTTTIDVIDADDLDSIKEVALYKSGAKTPLVTVDNDDFDISTTTATIEFTVSQAISADATENYVVKAIMDDGTVTTLGKDFDFELTTVEYRAASASSNVSYPVLTVSETYTISSDKPTFTLSKDGNKINVVVTNNSEYELNTIEFTLKVIGDFVDGNDLLSAALASSTWIVKDDSDREISSATAVYDASTKLVTVTLPATYSINDADTDTFVIEMDEGTTIRSEYYTVSEKSMSFIYSDGTDDSAVINATY